jgi:hypothetical protein
VALGRGGGAALIRGAPPDRWPARAPPARPAQAAALDARICEGRRRLAEALGPDFDPLPVGQPVQVGEEGWGELAPVGGAAAA